MRDFILPTGFSLKKIACLLTLFALSLTAFAQDLVLSSVVGPKTVEQNKDYTLDVTLKNAGVVDITGYSSTWVYVSSDDNLNMDTDSYVNFILLQGLPAGESKTFTIDFKAPSITPGVYNLLVTMDYGKVIDETDEQNNFQVLTGYNITAADVDLDIPSFTITSPTVAQSDQIFVNYRVRNNGTSPLNKELYTGFYLSADNTLDQGDLKLGTSYLNMAGAAMNDVADRLILPKTTPLGDYYLIAKADDQFSDIIETNESNNTAVVPIKVVASDIDLDMATALPFFVIMLTSNDRQLNLNFAVKNNGTSGAIDYDGDVYLSADRTLSVNDIKLTFRPFTASHRSFYVPARSSAQVSFYSQIGGEVAAGNYYVIIKLNPNGTLAETSLTNNIGVSANAITVPPPIYNIETKSAALGKLYEENDMSVHLLVSFENQGDPGFFSKNYIFYIKDSNGVIISSLTRPVNFNMGFQFQTSYESIFLSLTEPLAPGNYSIEVQCAGPGVCTPTFLSGFQVSPTTYTLSGNIKGEDGTPLTKGKLFLYSKAENGVISITQRIVPITSDDFLFEVSKGNYTMFFIPDVVQYPDYVPTVLGKSVTLTQSSFVDVSADNASSFEILKLQPAEAGGRKITGNIVDGSAPLSLSGRGASPQSVGAGSYIVVLMTDSGLPVRITRTNIDGYYEFNNVAASSYKIQIVADDESLPDEQSVPVNVTIKNAKVDFQITTSGATSEVAAVSLDQQIQFASLSARTFGDEPFNYEAASSSSLALLTTSSNPAVASVIGNKITIHAAGETMITVTQSGNDVYNAALPVSQVLRVNKADQQLSFKANAEQTYNDKPVALPALTNVGFKVAYTSSNTTVANIDGDVLSIIGAGECIITATQPGNANYNGITKVQTLTVRKASQVITFGLLADKEVSDADFLLEASATSLLGVSFTSDNHDVATIVGNKVSIHGPGSVNISATQTGNTNYEAAAPVARSLVINMVTSIEPLMTSIQLYPNPTTDIIHFNNEWGIQNVIVSNVLGERQPVSYFAGQIDVSQLQAGMYYVKIEVRGRGTATHKVIKQ